MATLDPNPQAPVTLTDSIRASLQAHLLNLAPYKNNIFDGDKVGLRTMADGREGYARLVCNIAVNHIDSIARELDPAFLSANLTYDTNLEQLRFALLKLGELVEEMQTNNGIKSMRIVDAFVDNMQVSRRNNGSLDFAMREVDEWNKRFGARPNATPVTPAEPEA